MDVLIVGASVAGVRVAQALRRGGWSGQITLVGEEPHQPYDKPPLTKQMLLGDGAPVPLLSPEEAVELDVDLRLGTRVVALDPGARTVTTEDGDRVPWTQLVIATGSTPRALPFPAPAGVHTIRTADDAVALRAALVQRPRVVVVGGGFVGAEFASAARVAGCEVTIVEIQSTPMAALLGARVGEALAELHRAAGVRVLPGVGVSGFEDVDGQVSGVRLDDGRTLPAELVVVGVGAVPATGWLAGSGLPVADGVECDASLAVLGHPDVHAVGDVARWPHPFYGSTMRIEHWTNASEHAAIVAAHLTGQEPPAAQVPYVWSDQHGRRIQVAGRPGLGELHGMRSGDDGRLAALYADADGVAVGAVVVGDPRGFIGLRRALAARTPARDVVLPEAPASSPAR